MKRRKSKRLTFADVLDIVMDMEQKIVRGKRPNPEKVNPYDSKALKRTKKD